MLSFCDRVFPSHLILGKNINYKTITSIFFIMSAKINNYHYDDKSIRCCRQRHHVISQSRARSEVDYVPDYQVRGTILRLWGDTMSWNVRHSDLLCRIPSMHG